MTANSWQAVERLYTQDISRGGTFVAAERPLPPGSRVALRLTVPDGTLIELNAVVAWAGDGVKRPRGMGLQFDTPAPDVLARLDALIRAAREESPPTLEELVETLAQLRIEGPGVLQLRAGYCTADLDQAFMRLAKRFDPTRFPKGQPERKIANDLAGLLREAYQRAAAGARP